MGLPIPLFLPHFPVESVKAPAGRADYLNKGPVTKGLADDVHRQDGMTLAEMLVAIAIAAVLVTLSATAVRHYSLVQSLEGAVDEVGTYLKRAHTRATSESHPRVYGAWFIPGASEYHLVLFDPDSELVHPETEMQITCTVEQTRSLGGGMFGQPVRVSPDPAATWFASSQETNACRAQLAGVGENDQFVFFYARGEATGGRVTLEQPTLDRTRELSVSDLTGRVDLATEEETP
jgi:prepilin-type N-terminal cleavage/methylation domain-containing protein